MKNPCSIKKDLQLNNRGASLLLVVIAFLFMATLSTIIVSAAVKNSEMKTVNKRTKENFYMAEAAMDEIKAGLTEAASKEISEAYTKVLSEYSTKNAAMRKAYFNQTFTDGMKSALNVSQDPKTGIYTVNNLIISGYLKETKKNSETTPGAEVVNNIIWQVTDGKAITLKNVTIKYTNGNYTSKISTDIKIMYPGASFLNLNGYVEATPFIKYALIAQDSIWASLSSHKITGSVYAGINGINVSNKDNSLEISNGRVISAGNITVTDKAIFDVEGTNSEVWATNLMTTQSNKSLEEGEATTDIKINGNSYIKDDLIVDAKNSKIELLGQYYGYSSSDMTREQTAGNNSAITVNAANASLKLDGLSKLYLAGRAFLNLDNSNIKYAPDNSYGLGDKANSNIVTGESLTVKGSQEAYLLPSQYIKVGHNPVSWDEYKLYYNNLESIVDIPSEAIAFNNSSIRAEERRLSYYLDSSEPYKKVFYQFGSYHSNMVYYYLNFASKDKATTYFKNFKICYPDIVYNGFPIKGIVLNNNNGSIITAGNLTAYDEKKLQIMEGNNGEYPNNYATQYNNLSHTLQLYTDSQKSLFDTLINSKAIESDATGDGTMNDPYYVRIIKGDFSLNEADKSGMIIATGNVTVNKSFTGTIIAGGTITLCGGANVNADPSTVSAIINNNDAIKKYFVEFSGKDNSSGKLKTINMKDLIVYENWKKNEREEQ